jgi:hypothetical protein
VTENKGTFLVTTESKDCLHRLIFPHVFQEEVSNFAIIREVAPSTGSSCFLTGKSGPQFNGCIAKVTASEDSADIALG